MLRTPLLIGAGALIATAGAATSALAGFAAVTDRVAYTGQVTVYDTLGDAQAGANARTGPHTIPNRNASAPNNTPDRDAGIFFRNNHGSGGDANIFLTAWYYTNNPAGNDVAGWGNPNNTNTGFMQMYDADGSQDIATSASFGAFNGTHFTEFTLQASIANAGADDTARMWHAPDTGGAAALTAGMFHSFDLNITFGGLEGEQTGTNVITATDHPDSVTGSLTGIFENTNASDSSLNGFYSFEYTFNMNSWVWEQYQNGDLDEDVIAFGPSFFQVVPLPSGGLLGLAGLAGVASVRRRGA